MGRTMRHVTTSFLFVALSSFVLTALLVVALRAVVGADALVNPLPRMAVYDVGRALSEGELESLAPVSESARNIESSGYSELLLINPDTGGVAARLESMDLFPTTISYSNFRLDVAFDRLSAAPLVFFAIALGTQLGFLVTAIWRARDLPPPERVGGVAADIGFGVLVGAVGYVAVSGLEWVQAQAGVPVFEQAWFLEAARGSLAPWLWVIGVVAAPICEEGFFRRYVFRKALESLSFPAAASLSAILFALIHMNPTGILAYFTYGWILAWAYHRRGALVVPILAHATSNAITILALG